MKQIHSGEGELASGPSTDKNPRITSLQNAREQASSLIVYLYVWGTTWLALAGCGFYRQFGDPAGADTIITTGAIAATALIVFLQRKRRVNSPSCKPANSGISIMMLAGLMLLLFAFVDIMLIAPSYRPIVEGIVLVAIYGLLSRWLGWPLLALGLWQLAVTVTVAWSYLGFAPVLIRLFGGAGMLGFAILIHIWKKGRENI